MIQEMVQDIEKVLYTQEEIRTRVEEMGQQLAERFAGKNPLFVCVLKGSILFFSDLIRACPLKSQLDFLVASSYRNATQSSGAVELLYDIQADIRGREVILVEDILDTGRTLALLKKNLEERGAKVTIVVLLDKPARRVEDCKAVTPDYTGYSIPDAFVVGYGLDYGQYYRNLPFIGVLKPEVYSQ